MDHLWTPWRYNYITGSDTQSDPDKQTSRRKGVPTALDGWPGEDLHCVFCNLNASVAWGLDEQRGDALQVGYIIARLQHCFICLNAYPYSSGHVLIIPYRHTDSLAKLEPAEAFEIMQASQKMETVLREVYDPGGINLGINLGEAAGAGVAAHLHIHMLPRWFGDTNFMTATAETRILPETLDVTWMRLKAALQSDAAQSRPIQGLHGA